MFSLSPTQQFLIQKGLQAAAGGQGQPGQQGQMPMPSPQPMMRNPNGMQVSPQSRPGMLNLGSGGGKLDPSTGMATPVNPGIMDRFRSMVTNQLAPQLRSLGAGQMMPPQGQ